MSRPLTLIIFGATGDLTSRKLIPSLFRASRKKRLPEQLQIVGVARSELTTEQFRAKLGEAGKTYLAAEWDEAAWNAFMSRVHYARGDATRPEGLEALKQWLLQAEKDDAGDRLYYLSVAPHLYSGIACLLGEAGMSSEESGWRRLIIEKPFGHDLESAKQLNQAIHSRWNEQQIYRIDHYLGKETVQNFLVFRFANTLFEPVWNHNYINSVQITVSETEVVGQRGDYYDTAGVLRDMFQNHLLQLLALIAMEGPARFVADAVRNEKVKVLDAIEPLDLRIAMQSLALGQYEGYCKERGVAAGSRTPTFAAAKLCIHNWRWRGVPFYLRSGKGLKDRRSEVVVEFHSPPHLMFPLPAGTQIESNRLTLAIQPDEGISLRFQSKVPDQGMELRPADLDFRYGEAYPMVVMPEAYERLLLDAMNGDATLFMRSDEIERAWLIMDPLIAAAEDKAGLLPEQYAVGSEGPRSATELLARDGHKWAER